MCEATILKALEMLENRAAEAQHYENYEKATAYRSACDILRLAIDGNTDCLKEFDYVEPPAIDHTRYSDCYQGCGGEDCACCEIHADHVREMSTPHEEDLYGSYDDEPPEDYSECPECCEGCRWADTCERYEEEELIERDVVESEFAAPLEYEEEALDDEA